MKNTISASIGGMAFNVEEDAHAKLSAYLGAINNSLKNSEGLNEIMADIESRIAEILQQKISSYKQVITLADIDEVISIMGKPEDFGAEPGAAKQEQPSGGSNQTYVYGRRRVYRDPDDRVLFGVCSGLSHHFGIDPIWLRLAFGLSTLIGGFGFILYILLAIILPKARTTAEKLEMMGEPVDVNNIRKTIEDEMETFKNRMKDLGNEFKSNRNKDRAQRFGKDVGDFASSVGHGAGNVLRTIFAVICGILAFFFLILLIAFIVSVTSGVNIVHIESGHHWMHYSFRSFLDMLSVTGGLRTLLVTGILLFFGVPLLAIVVRFIRLLMGRRRHFQWFTITASILWGIAWVLLIIGIGSTFSHLSVSDSVQMDVPVSNTSPKTLYLKLNDNSASGNVVELDSLNLYISGEGEFRGNPRLCIEQSPDSNYHLVLTKSAKGVTKAEADKFADDVEYTFTSHDSTLTLDPYFSYDLNKGWHKQKLELLLQVPLNKNISLPEEIDNILCSALHHKGQHMGGEICTMTQTGLVPYSPAKN